MYLMTKLQMLKLKGTSSHNFHAATGGITTAACNSVSATPDAHDDQSLNSPFYTPS